MPKGYDDKTKKHAIELFKMHGVTIASQTTGISQPTIKKWARAVGAQPPSRGTKNTARVNYTQAERLRVLNLLAERIETLLEHNPTMKPRELQSLILGFAVIIDKRRLEEGKGNDVPASQEELEKIVKEAGSKVTALRKKRAV